MCDCIILAAGNSTRMRSKKPKIFHKVGNLPIIEYVIKNALVLKSQNLILVIDKSYRDEIENAVRKYTQNFKIVVQDEKLGTGHAVLLSSKHISNDTVIMYGDTPFVSHSTLQKMLTSDNDITLLGFESNNPEYGRIIKNGDQVSKIVERGDVCHIANSGIMSIRKGCINLIHKIPISKKGEYYLTDIVGLAVSNSKKVGCLSVDATEAHGINDRSDLSKAEHIFQELKRSEILKSGVTLISPKDIFFSYDTEIGEDSIIYP